MKKILLGLFALGMTLQTNAQEAAEKDVQAGIVASFGLNFQNVETKLMSTNGVGTDLTVGSNVNFMFNNKNLAFNTGVEFDFETIKYSVGSDQDVFYWYSDSEILQKEDVADASGAELFQLSTRTQKPVYLSIPTMLMFRTNFIGYLRYFGKFGLRNSFLLTSKINDTGFNLDPDIAGTPFATGAENVNMRARNDLFFFKSAVGFSGGAEWNFSGATSLVAELGFYYGFTPLHTNRDEEKTTLFTAAGLNGTTENNHFSNKATQRQLQLKISILF